MPYNADGLYYADAEIHQQLKQHKKNFSDLDHSRNNEIKCPYCGHDFIDSWEFSDCHNDTKIECGNCENTFMMIAEPEVYYSTWKLKEPQNDK